MADSQASPVAGLPAGALPALLELLPGGVVYYLPQYDAAGAVVDFRFAYLNPAAQRMLALPAQPAASFLEQWPGSGASGAWVFYQTAFGAEAPAERVELYQADGYDYHLTIQARRLAAGLLVHFTSSSEPVRAAAEASLLATQAREQQVATALQQAEQQYARLARTLGQVPAAVATLSGPEHRFAYFNERYQAISAGRVVLGLSVAEVFPEVVAQGFIGLLDQVYTTGQPYVSLDTPIQLYDAATGYPAPHYLDFVYQPITGEQGQGILVFVLDVTEKLVARQQVQTQERRTNRLNEELQAANAEILANNTILARTQAELYELNGALEARVAERTQELAAALAEAEHQREQLRTQQSLLSQVLGQMPAYIGLMSGPEHRFSYYNEPFTELLNGTPELGVPMAQALPHLMAQGFGILLDQVYTTGETYVGQELPTQINQPTGPPLLRYFDFSYRALRDGAGRVNGILGFAVDVSEQVRARQAHEAQQRLVQQLVQQSPAAVASYEGPAHRLAFFNEPYQQLVGRPLTLDQTVRELFPDLAAQGFFELLDQVYQQGEAVARNEALVQFWDPQTGQLTPQYVNVRYQPLLDTEGQPTGVLVTGVLVTEQVLARQQVQALNEALTATNNVLAATNGQLMRTNVDLDTFIYTASHDLKAPITNIEAILLALREHLPAAVRQEELVAHLLDLLGSTASRFQATIAQLTDISKQQQVPAGPAEAVPLADLLAEVCLDLAPAIAEAQAQLTVDIAPELLVYFLPKTVRSVVYNLLSNALKYRQPQQPLRVVVQAAQAEGGVVLTVQDNGLGLTPTQQGRLFGLFQRLHTHVEGTGVGLYLIKRLLENGNGTITVRSQEGIGSTFTVTFPHYLIPSLR